MSSFTKKKIRVTVTLADGDFGLPGLNTLTFDGLRTVAHIQQAGGVSMGVASIRIYGMTQSDMNKLTTLTWWRPLSVIKNTIRIEAGDDDGMSEVYFGNIYNAWGDYQAVPDACLYIEAQAAYFDQINPVQPSSYTGAADVAGIMSKLAASMGMAFENNGVATQLSNPYLPGTLVDQVKQTAAAANIEFYFDGNVLAITPKGGTRAGVIPLISPQSGLIGYPTFDKTGVMFNCLHDPAILFGGTVDLDTVVEKARGIWKVTSISHHLESELPSGAWFSQVNGTEPGNVVISR